MQDAGDVGKQIFQHCLTPHCRMLQQQCYVMVIFLWVPVAAQATFQDLAAPVVTVYITFLAFYIEARQI